MSIRILIADDHRIMREGLRSLMESEPDIEVVAEAKNGRQTVQLARELSPEVIIMDVSMPDLNGIEATRQIASELPDTKIVALSMHRHEQFVQEMFRAGAAGYLLKDSSADELTHAVRVVAGGEIYLSPWIASIIVEDYVRHSTDPEVFKAPILTAREREVLQLLSEGKTAKEIASYLNISVKTVETHRRKLMNKLGVKSIAELTKYAIRKGLTSLDT